MICRWVRKGFGEERRCPARGECRAWTGEVQPDFQEVLCAVTPRAQFSKHFSAVKNKLPGEAGRGLVWNSITAPGAE